jgi:hypothetical protein
VKRISAVLNSKEQNVALYDLYEATVRKSFVLSSDQAHALHPNYASKVCFLDLFIFKVHLSWRVRVCELLTLPYLFFVFLSY